MVYGVGEAPGKIILMGEHAVVYGAPAIALPFFSVGVKCTVRSHPGDTYIKSVCYEGPLTTSPSSVEGIKKLIEVTLDHLKQENKDLKIIIESLIPPQRGLGSSAAVDAYHTVLSFDILNQLVSIAESIHHFKPSGLDAATILNEKLTVYQKGNPFYNPKSTLEGYLVVGDSGIEGNTKQAVSEVKQRFEDNPNEMREHIEQISQLTLKTELALLENNIHTVGVSMLQAHSHLKKMGVSDATMDNYVEVAMDAGAFGAKITGGGKGGCMIAIVNSVIEAEKISQELLKAGMKQTWVYNMKEVQTHASNR